MEHALGVKELHYAATPFVFVTDQDAAQTQLDSSEIVSIYDGRKTRWNDGTPLRIILRPETEADTTLIQKYIPGMQQAMAKAYARRGPPIAITDQDAADKVQMIKGALGMSTMSLILGEHRPLKAFSFNGISPTVENLANGSYPMSKNLYLVIGHHPKAEALRFIDFIFSAEGMDILKRTGHLVVVRQDMPAKP